MQHLGVGSTIGLIILVGCGAGGEAVPDASVATFDAPMADAWTTDGSPGDAASPADAAAPDASSPDATPPDGTPFDPSGTYWVTPVASYSCASGFVSFNLSATALADDGATLTASGAPCTMSGASAVSTMSFDATCTIVGPCTETYRLVGTFSSDSTWTGTFQASYAGACFDCTARTFSVNGVR